MPETPHDVTLMTTDQQRADLCAPEGFEVDCTPTLDQLARQGCWFSRAYTAAPVCVPARVSLLTGRIRSSPTGRWTVAGLVPMLNEVTQGGALRMVRSDRWKLQASVSGELSLFDLENDPTSWRTSTASQNTPTSHDTCWSGSPAG